MITTLHIKNIGIIEDLSIDFNQGLNVLTGETGAGKTLIMDSLSILSGGRFSKEMIRKGENYSWIEACIYVPNHLESMEGNIIISREIQANGRNMCKINGRMVTVNELREFMVSLLEIHGQNDNQCLMDAKFHLNYLDGYIGKPINKIKQNYQEKYEKYKKLKKELKENYGDDKERERKLDLLKYQFQEIEEANLKTDEEEELEENRKIILHAEKIIENLKCVDQAISEETIDTLSVAIRSLEKIEGIDSKYEVMSGNLKNIYYEIQEMARDIKNYQEEVDFEEEQRNEIEERLNLIHSLKRKYGNTIQEIAVYKNQIEEEIKHIENLEEYHKNLKKQIQEIEREMEKLADQMHQLRTKYGEQLSQEINQILEELEMKNANITIHVDDQQEKFLETGKDNVEFYITTNLGEDEKPLAKIASGGEMARIMLAIKKVLADTDQVPILVFDEIDTGISGKAANSVAEKLSSIAKKHQVLCISHLPNIAAMADYHYFISKKVTGERTNTNICLLTEKEAIQEVARISSGEINEVSIQYATELKNKKAC